MNKKIRLKEKIIYSLLAAFLLLSLNTNILAFIWQGFHFPNGLPGRFSFIYIFLLIRMGGEGLARKSGWPRYAWPLSVVPVGALLGWACFHDVENISDIVFWVNIGLAAVYLILTGMAAVRWKGRRAAFIVLVSVFIAEICANSVYGLCVNGTVDRKGYYSDQDSVRKLKARLEGEGLFRPEHKKPLPAYPRCIGVVTSATGAALQDIRNVLGRRWPLAALLLAGVNVQGLAAAGEIRDAIARLDESGLADVIIVARGGGSREDLWVFNDEGIARAAYACKTPLISAVGHEIDVSILDYVADLRAPTPSAAAELATPDRAVEAQKIYTILSNIHENMHLKREMCYNGLYEAIGELDTLSAGGLCAPRAARLAYLASRLRRAKDALAADKARSLTAACALTHSLSPYAVLGRGYAIVRDGAGRCLAVEQLAPGQQIRLRGARSEAVCHVNSVMPLQEDLDETPQDI